MTKDYKTFEELKEELGDKFEEFMYKANIELLEKVNQLELDVDSYKNKYERANELYLDTSKKLNQLETNRDEALKTTKELYEEGVEWHWDNGSLEMYVLDLLSILERGKE